jgi:hypothetical protein
MRKALRFGPKATAPEPVAPRKTWFEQHIEGIMLLIATVSTLLACTTSMVIQHFKLH